MRARAKRHAEILGVYLVLLCLPGLAGPANAATLKAERRVLSNRLVVVLREDHSLPLVTLHLVVDAGSWRDPRGKEGLAHLTAKSLLHGTFKHDATALADELDFMGASLEAACGRDIATLTLRVLKKDLDKGFDLFAGAVMEPAFPEDEVRRQIEETLATIQADEDRPEAVAEKAFRKALYMGGPYAHPVEGTEATLRPLSRDDVARFYRAYYHPNNSVLVVVGDLTAADVESRLVPRLSQWPVREIPRAAVTPSFARGPLTVKIDRPLTQANLVLGNPGLSRNNPDYYAASVMNYVLGGGGFASRLLEEIRNKRGLAYSVESFFGPGRFPGSFQIVLQTKNASAREAIALALGQMRRMREEMVSERELEGAKRYLVGSFPLRIDTQAKLADILGQLEYYGLGLDYPERYPSLIRAVTREDVLRVARAYLHPDDRVLVAVANLKEAGLD